MPIIFRALFAGAIGCFLLISKTAAQPGAVDISFYAGSGVDFEIFQVALQSSGKIIIGGGVGSPSPGVARVNGEGSPDRSFNGGAGVNPSFDYTVGSGHVYAIAVQPDDKII